MIFLKDFEEFNHTEPATTTAVYCFGVISETRVRNIIIFRALKINV